MFILFMAYILMLLWGVKINLKDRDYFNDYISLDKTTSIKGIFIMLVFFSHFNKYATYSGLLDTTYFKIVGLVGQIMVVPFLFYSGYGVMESIKKKGSSYVSGIPKNRILKVFLQFAISIVLFLGVKNMVGEKLSLSDVILSFLAWERDWFVLAIIFLYIFTYISFKVIKNKSHLVNIFLVLLFTILYIIIISHFKSRYWYDTVLCYPLGMIWSLYRDKIEKLTADRLYKWIISVIVLGILATGLKVFGNNAIMPVLLGFIFTGIFIVVFTMRVSLNNKVLNWLGKYLFEIYLLHSIPMIILSKLGLISINAPAGFVISLVVTIGLAYLFSKLYKKLWEFIQR